MKKIKLFVSIGLLSLLIANPVLAQENLDITGSNTLFPIMESASAAYQEANSDIAIDVSGPGSGAGITALIDGQTDLYIKLNVKFPEKLSAVDRELLSQIKFE